MIIYENHFIILKVKGQEWFYLIKKNKDTSIYPHKHKTSFSDLESYFKNYHKRIESKVEDMT